MPFVSKKQREYLWARHPEIAKRWTEKYGSSIRKKEDNPGGEADFRKWYAGHAAKLGLNPDPDAPQHHYDYRAAYRAGAKPDASGHWPSKYKREGHPRLIINGIDTRTGRLAMPNERKTGRNVLSYYARALKRKGMRPLTAREREKQEAERRRLAERRKIESHYEGGRRRTAEKKPPPTPKTPAQIRSEEATEFRKKFELPGLGALREALTPRKKKKL